MIDFVFLVPICSLLCLGVNALTRRGALFGFWSVVVVDDLNENRFAIADPLSECLLCMSSFYGTIILSIHSGVERIDVACFLFLALNLIFALFQALTYDREFWKTAKIIYLISIFFFLCSSVKNPVVESVVFLFAASGFNYFLSVLMAEMKSNVETNQQRNENAVDQSSAVRILSEAIKGTKSNN